MYLRGFEDAVELCYSKVMRARDLEEAKRLIEEVFYAVKEKKIWWLERELG
jgi:AraC-like DNA-binding protein